MWFKNLQLYRLPAAWAMGLAALEEQLARGPFVPCGANQATSRGWVSPRKDGSLVFSLGNQWLIALKTEIRLLPADVVAKEVAERAAAIEAEQGYAPGRKQLRELKERVTEELMPRAFTRSRVTYAWIDRISGTLAIDAGTPALAEALIEHLRHCLDELPLSFFRTHISPTSAMADWLAGDDAPSGFSIDYDCELQDVSECRALVKYARGPLDPDQIKDHLTQGKLPTRLALTWDDRISFVLTEKLEVKRLAFLDIVKEQAEAEHADEQFDADFALMTGELVRFIPQLLDALGGEAFEA